MLTEELMLTPKEEGSIPQSAAAVRDVRGVSWHVLSAGGTCWKTLGSTLLACCRTSWPLGSWRERPCGRERRWDGDLLGHSPSGFRTTDRHPFPAPVTCVFPEN